MSHVFAGLSANEVWHMAAEALSSSPEVRLQNSRTGSTRELMRTCIQIKNPCDRWVVLREPALNPAFALAEVIWIVNGRKDSKFLNYWNSQLPKFAGTGEEYHGAYGWRLRNHLGVDQLDRAYHALRNNPESRQVVLQIWDSSEDLPHRSGQPVSEDIPCNLVSMLKIRDGKLEWTQVMRSNDIFRGLPHNIIQFTFLQEIIAGWLQVDVGEYVQLSDSLHVYEDSLEFYRRRARVVPLIHDDSVAVDKTTADSCWRELSLRVDRMIDPALKESEVFDLMVWADAPRAFQNILLVLCAECARRRHYTNALKSSMELCMSPTYKQLWARWCDRLKKPKASDNLGSCRRSG